MAQNPHTKNRLHRIPLKSEGMVSFLVVFGHILIFKKANFYDILWKFTEINQIVTFIPTFTKVVKFPSTLNKFNFYDIFKSELMTYFWPKCKGSSFHCL